MKLDDITTHNLVRVLAGRLKLGEKKCFTRELCVILNYVFPLQILFLQSQLHKLYYGSSVRTILGKYLFI